MSLVHVKETLDGDTVVRVPVVEVDGHEYIYRGADDAESVGRFIDDTRDGIYAGVLDDLAEKLWKESGFDEHRARRMSECLAMFARQLLDETEYRVMEEAIKS